jgi:iron complex outermembrane recepter protein
MDRVEGLRGLMSNRRKGARSRAGRQAFYSVASSACIIGVGLLGAASAEAQTAPATTANNSAPAETSLSEVTITAEKKSENLQNTSISATVRSFDELKEEGINNVQDLQMEAPGVAIQPPLSSETFINIRGVGIQQTNPVSSNGVAFYIDGQAIPSLIDTVDSFYDIQDVEVLRGPQGTLVGSNSDGGAIFINSVQPSLDAMKGYIEQTFGNYNERRTEGAINVPLGSMFAARVAFVYETRDSFTENLGVGPSSPNAKLFPGQQNQPGNVDFNAVRAQLLFQPNEDFQYTLRYEPYSSRTDGFAVKPDVAAVAPLAAYYKISPTAYLDPTAVGLANQPFKIDYDQNQYFNISGQRSTGTGIWHITPGIELKSVTSYQTGYESDLSDLDYSSAPANVYLQRRANFKTYTQEFNLLSTDNSPFQWVVGGYYLNSHGPLNLEFVNGGAGPLSVNSDHVNYAGFASGTYKFTDQWSVTVGGRYSHDLQPYHEFGDAPIPNAVFTSQDTEPTGEGKINFQVTPETLIYASIANGYKAGGENLQIPPIIEPGAFKPEKNVVEELGLKTTVLDGHLRIDGDVFNSRYTDFQIQETLVVSPFPGLTIQAPFTQTPGAARIYGAEAEFTGAFDTLQMNLGGSYLHARTSGVFAFTSPNGVDYAIPSDTEVPFAPDFTLTAGVQYGIPMSFGGVLTPRVQFQYQGLQYVTIAHDIYPLSLGSDIPGHGTADFRLTYNSGEKWQVEAYVTNLTNHTYIANSLPSAQAGAPPGFAYGAPIQGGGRFTYRF